MNNKRIIIISRTIFPNKAPRAARATELAKEFAARGYQVELYAVMGRYDYTEFSAKHNIQVRNIGEMKFATLNSDGKRKDSFILKALTRLFNNLLEFPDVELMFRIRKLLQKTGPADLLVTVAVPFPLHWGAAWAKTAKPEAFSACWIADCGDPYMGNKILKKPFYFKYVEKWFCRKADYITVPIAEAIPAYYPEFHSKIHVIPQGFDFSVKVPEYKAGNAVPTFIYAGVFYKNIRDPRPLLDYLSTLDTNFKFIIFTKSKALIQEYTDRLGDKLEVRDYIPREALLAELSAADFLVNLENNSGLQSPSKLIDYALSRRPILSVNSNKLNTALIQQFLNGDYSGQTMVKDIDQFNIATVASKFLQLAGLEIKS